MLTVQEMQELNGGVLVPQETETFLSPVPIETAHGQSDDPTRNTRESKDVNDLAQQYNRLSMRYKHVVEERDAMSTQIAEFRRRQAEEGEGRAQYKAEALKLLGKLVDEEARLRESSGGTFPSGDDPFARHEKFVKAFFNLVPSGEEKM
jgi:aspartate oxidase